MATPYSTLYGLFLTEIQDYRIDKLTGTDLNNYLKGFLLLAIPEFDTCAQDLTSRNDTTQTFTITLTEEEISILVKWMVFYWFTREVQNISQFNLLLNDTDFRRYAESQNLKEKTNYLTILREMYTQKNVDYALKNNSWSDWWDGTYATE